MHQDYFGLFSTDNKLRFVNLVVKQFKMMSDLPNYVLRFKLFKHNRSKWKEQYISLVNKASNLKVQLPITLTKTIKSKSQYYE